MERPLTAGAGPRQFHRLPYSPSTPAFTSTSTSTPPKRTWSKIKSLFRRHEETTRSQPLLVSSPYSFDHLPTTDMESENTRGRSALASQMEHLSVGSESTVVGHQSPTQEQSKSKVEGEVHDPEHATRGLHDGGLDFGFMAAERAQEENEDYGLSPAAREAKRLGLDFDFPPTPREDDDLTLGARRLNLEPDSANANLTPVELEALERGLNLDFSPSHAMQLASPADDRVVREYTTIGPEYYAARADKPIFDGKSVSKGKSKATSSLTPPPPTAPLTPIGSWRCCKCADSHALHAHPSGAHITSVFTCTCPHRSCEDCILTGSIKPYTPLEEPILVQVSSAGHVLFGIVCSACGVAWRAQTVKPSVYTKLAGKSSTLNLRAFANDMVREHGKQAGSAMVGFTGGACECGHVLSEGCLIFQILDTGSMMGGGGGGGTMLESEEVVPDVREKSFGATLEDRAKGIGKSTLTIEVKGKRVRHANPLMSNPV